MRLLIAEDQESVVEILRLALNQEKFIVDFAMDGQRAFELARRERYDVIILDIMLPLRSGFEIITALRAMKNNTPILVISSRGSLEDKVMVLNLGADDYMVKDFAIPELMARVKSLARRSKGESKNIFFCQDLILNFSTMTVKRSGKLVKLTRKEFILLSKLLRNKNKVVAIEDLITTAWSSLEPHCSNKLNVHIRALRAKIDDNHSKKLIKTVRGFGYKISDER